MRMRKRGLISMAVTVITLFIAGCFHNVHEFRASEWGDDVEVGYIVTSLLWGQNDDKGTDVDDITIGTVGSGVSFSKHYDDVEEVSKELVQLPTGEYDMLVTVNMSDADGFVLTGMPAAKGTASTLLLGDVAASLKDPASSPAQAWYGLSHVRVTGETITVVEPVLQRLLSVLTLNLANVPAGTSVTISVNNVSKKVILTAKDSNGRYGLPASGDADSVILGTFSATATGTLGVSEFTMLPTASDKERCLITIDVTTPSGQHLTHIGDAPRTECGKSYTLNLDYNTLKPYMYVASSDINAWTEGWTVTGEILNPND